MLGLSDTTLGAITSVLLHVGVVAAFFGPLGSGEGAGDRVVMVTIDGAEEESVDGEEPVPQQASIPHTKISDPAPGSVQVKPEKQVAPAAPRPVKKVQRALQQPVEATSDSASKVNQGGGGLLGALYTQPRLLSIPKPAYPQTARSRGVEGKVGLKVYVTPDGTVERAEVVKSSGVESFDDAARESALAARFEPALQAGIPTAADKTIIVTFSLLE